MGYNAKVTSKGQITLPAEMRKTLNLQPGDKVTFSKDTDGRYYVEPKTETLAALRGIVKAEDVGSTRLEAWIEEARGRRGGGIHPRRKPSR